MSGRIRTDEVQLRVLIDGSPARKELAQLDQASIVLRENQKKLQSAANDAKKALDAAARGGDKSAIAAANAEMGTATRSLHENGIAIKNNDARMAELRKEIGLTSLSVKELRSQAAKLTAQLDRMGGESPGRAQLEEQLLDVQNRIKELTNATARADRSWADYRKEIRLTDMSIEQLEKEVKHLTTSLRTMDPKSAIFANTRRELASVQERLTTVQSGLGPFGRAWQSMKGSVAGTVAGLGAVLGGSAIISGIKSWITGSGKLSDELANMQKATGKTKAEIIALNSELTKLDTRTANTDLREIVVGLGQAGQEATAQAVAAIDKINVALGDEFGTGAKEITGQLSVLRNGFQDIKTGNYGEDVMRIGNALNVLGASGLATAPVVSDIASRVAGAATQYKIASGDVLGLAATFQELGINTERGSTAYIKVLQKIAGEPAKFAKVVKAAGMDVGLFAKEVNTDLQAAFVTVAKAAKSAGSSNTAFAAILGELGTEGVGVGELLSKIGANSELLAKKTKLAGDALKNTASITEEFNTKNTTLGAQLEKIGKAMAGAFVNSSITSGIKSIVDQIVRWTETPLSETLEEERIGVQKTYAMILTYNEGNVERAKLIRQLQDQYPGFLSNINAETVGNKELGLAIAELNQQLVNKIILQKKDEEIQAQIETQAARQLKVLASEDAVREKMVKLAERYNLQLKEGVPLLQQASDIQNQITEGRRKSGKSEFGGVAFDEVARFSKAIGELSTSYSFLNSEQGLSNKLTEERGALLQRLGITPAAPTATPAGAVPGAPLVANQPVDDGAAIASKQAREEASKNMDALRKVLEGKREELYQAMLGADQKERRALVVKQEEERALMVANAQHTAEQLLQLDELHTQERENLIKQQGDRRAAAAKEAADKVSKAEQDAQDQVYQDQLSAADREIDVEMRKLDELAAIYERAGFSTQKVVERTEKAIAKIRKKYREQEKQEAINTRKEALEGQIRTLQGVATGIAGANALLEQVYIANGKRNYQQTVAAKALGLVQIGIASAVGVADAIKAGAGLPFPANLGAIATGVGAVLSGIASAMALLRSTPEPSADAGNVSGGSPQASLQNVPLGAQGVPALDGPPHSAGGLGVYDENTGQKKYELEGGEAVVAKEVTRQNPALISALMVAGRSPNKKLTAAVLDQVLSPTTPMSVSYLNSTPQPINVPAVRQALSVEKFAMGGVVTGGAVYTFIKGKGGINAPGDGDGGPNRSNVNSSGGAAYTFTKGKGGVSFDETNEILGQILAATKASQEELAAAIRDFPTTLTAVTRLGPEDDRERKKWEKLKARNTVSRRA